jgi:hypothetical protein
MRSFIFAVLAATAFGGSLVIETTEANAAVCAKGVVRAGCVGPRGAVVARRPVAVCRTVIVNGVRVRRCT